jgi:DNA-3-methyladenine glycosylase
MGERTALGRAFFARDALEVARDLVGAVVEVDDGDDGVVSVRLVETEAYTADDPACHAYRGRTERNAPLFGPAGHAYVYRSYGIHWCCNVATGQDGCAQGVLLRAAEPLAGLATIRARRGDRVPQRDLLRGPGRLTQALAVDGSLSGADLCVERPPLWLLDDGAAPAVEAGPRVGVSRAADRPWRFTARGSRWVSPYKRHPRAREAQPAS